MNDPHLFCIMGGTCAGKTTLFDHLRKDIDIGMLNFGLIEVGKEMRKRYPPGHFNGLSNPEHTAEEAWEIFESEYEHLKEEEGRLITLCDGQPRDTAQAIQMCDVPNVHFILLDCEHSLRIGRARTRFPDDEAATKLVMERLDNDYRGLYDVLLILNLESKPVKCINSTHAHSTYTKVMNYIRETIIESLGSLESAASEEPSED